MEPVFNFIDSEESSQALCFLGLGLLGVLITKKFLPADDRALKLDVFVTLNFSRHRLFVIDEEEHDGLGRHQVFLDVREVRGVTMFVEQVQNFFSGKDFLDLVEDFKVIFAEFVIHLFHLDTNAKQKVRR